MTTDQQGANGKVEVGNGIDLSIHAGLPASAMEHAQEHHSSLPTPYEEKWTVVENRLGKLDLQRGDTLSLTDPLFTNRFTLAPNRPGSGAANIAEVVLRRSSGSILELTQEAFDDYLLRKTSLIGDLIGVFGQTEFLLGMEYLGRELHLVAVAPVTIVDDNGNPIKTGDALIAVEVPGVRIESEESPTKDPERSPTTRPQATHYGIVHSTGG